MKHNLGCTDGKSHDGKSHDEKSHNKNSPPAKCCDLAFTPHLHIVDGSGRPEKDIIHKIDTTFRATFFLKSGLLLPVTWTVGEMYHPDQLVIIGPAAGGVIWRCVKAGNSIPGTPEDWVQWALVREWRGHWSKYYEYAVGDIVNTSDSFYKCVIASPAGVYPQNSIFANAKVRTEPSRTVTTVLENPTTGRWIHVGDIGQQFGSWMKCDRDSITLDLDLSNNLRIHPTTGGIFWELPKEVYIGSEITGLEKHHSTIQELFQSHGETEVTKVFTIKTVHTGRCIATPTVDDPSPTEQSFFGLTMGVYIIPPKKMCDVSGDNTTTVETVESPDTSSFLDMVSPQTGKPFSDIYFQWTAEDMPFIIHSLSEEPTVVNSILCFTNRDPHEHYMKLFRNSACSAHHSNRLTTSVELFKREYMNECIRTGRQIPQGSLNEEYQKWKMGKLVEKCASLAAAEKMYQTAHAEWFDWMWKLRQFIGTVEGRINYIAQDYFGIEEWFNFKKSDCPMEKLQWTDKAGRIITAGEIADDLLTIERLWVILECAVGGLLTYYIDVIQQKINLVNDKLSSYKMKDDPTFSRNEKKRLKNLKRVVKKRPFHKVKA